MRSAFAAAVAILSMGSATAAIADGDDSGAGAQVIAADAPVADGGWDLASSAAVTYATSPDSASAAPVNTTDSAGVSQNYQVLDSNVLEYTQLVSGGEMMTLSGVLLQRSGDDSDAALLDEEASGVYSAGSAVSVPTSYEAVATVPASPGLGARCDSVCALVGGSSQGVQGGTETLASTAVSGSGSTSIPFPYAASLSWGAQASPFVDPSVYYQGLSTEISVLSADSGGVGAGPLTPQGPGLNPGQPGGVSPANPTVDVPEPGVWTLMLVGFSAIGAGRRRLRRASQAL